MRARSFVQLALVAMVAVAAAAPLSDFSDGTSVTWGGPQDGDDPSQPSGGLLSGSCGYGELQQTQWPFWAVAAISPSSALYTNATRHPMGGCGACLQIECVNDTQGFEGRCGPGAGASPGAALSVTVQVVDTCTSCGPTELAMPYNTMKQHLADPSSGEIAIRYRQVECTPTGNVTVDIDQYRATEGGYIRLALESAAGSGGIVSVELRQAPSVRDVGGVLTVDGTEFTALNNTYGARWELSGLPVTPLDLRITGDNGQTLIARHAINQAGVTGRFVTAVQFSTYGTPGVTDDISDPMAMLAPSVQCNATIYGYIATQPNLSQLVQYLDSAGVSPLLQQSNSTLTLMAPTNSAWANVPSSVHLDDKSTLRQVLLFLILQGQLVLPDASDMLPDDIAAGGVRLKVDTLQGQSLTMLAQPDAIYIMDGSNLTSSAPIVVPTNLMVCNSVVNRVTGYVPLPF